MGGAVFGGGLAVRGRVCVFMCEGTVLGVWGERRCCWIMR